MSPVAWVNMTVFDYTSQLQSGRFTLYAWPIEAELVESVHYMGSTVLNPSTTECVCLEIDINLPNLPANVSKDRPIMYPSMKEIEALNKEASLVATPVVSTCTCMYSYCPCTQTVSLKVHLACTLHTFVSLHHYVQCICTVPSRK